MDKCNRYHVSLIKLGTICNFLCTFHIIKLNVYYVLKSWNKSETFHVSLIFQKERILKNLRSARALPNMYKSKSTVKRDKIHS